jgi:hypothetical protein
MYDTAIMDPVGYLAAHKPVVANVMADWTFENRWGRTALGYIFTYESGTPYSHMRDVPAEYFNDALDYTDFGDIARLGKNNERTHGFFNSESYHDFAITHDLNVVKVADYKLRIFAKVSFHNVFNHQQQVWWNEPLFKAVTMADIRNAEGKLENVPWVEDPATEANAATKRGSFNNAMFGDARSVSISAGIRF